MMIYGGYDVKKIQSEVEILWEFGVHLVAASKDNPGLFTDDLSLILQFVLNLVKHPILEPIWSQKVPQLLNETNCFVSKFYLKLFSWLYNQSWMTRVTDILSSLSSIMPVERYNVFATPKFFYGVHYALKMSETDADREQIYFMLSNLVLNFRVNNMMLKQSNILELGLRDLNQGVLTLQTEVILFLGNISCKIDEFNFKVYLMKTPIFDTLLSTLFNFEDMGIKKLIVDSLGNLVDRFQEFSDRLEQNLLDHFLELGNDPKFMISLDKMVNHVFKKRDHVLLNNQTQGITKNGLVKTIDIINEIQECFGHTTGGIVHY